MLLGAGTAPVDRVTVAVLTTVIAEAGREIAACETEDEAGTVAAAIRVIRLLDPLVAGGSARS